MRPGLTTNKTLIAAIVLAMLVFIAMIVVSYRQTQYANNTAALVAHTQEELFTTVKVLSAITDNETGSRGFILTGRQDFLEPLERSKLNIYKEIDTLKQLTASNIHQQRYIDSLLFYANKRVFFSDSTIIARKEGGLTAAIQLVSTGRGKLYVDNIRRIINDMQGETNKMLRQSKAANTLAKTIEKIIFLAGTFITLTLIIIIFWKEKQRIQQKNQKNTAEQLALLSRQINQSNDAIYTLDAGSKIKSWNRGAEKLYGFAKEEVLGKDPVELLQTAITEEEIETAIKEITQHDYWAGELKRKTKAGEVIYVYASTTNIRDDNGMITGYVAVSFDISQRKRLEDELKRYSEELEQRVNERTAAIQQSEKNYRYLFQNNPLPMWVFDISSYKFLDVNEMATVHYGYSRDEFLSMTVLDIRPDEDKNIFLQTEHAFEINQVNNDKTIWNHRKKDGTVIQVEVSAHQINFEKKPARLILTNDVTERKKAEESIKKLNAELEERVIKRTEELQKVNEELEAFSYSVSHDLRAPLRAIIGYSAMLEEDYSSKLDSEAKRITTVIKNNTVKMGNLIDDLLTFSRMGRHEIIKTQIDNNAMVDEIIKGFNGDGSKIKWTVNPLPVVKADMSMLRQVWINLISNAVKYSGVNTAPKIEIGSFKHDGHLVFFVEDNGVGFDEKYKNKLFKVFQRLHSAEDFAGTGVGLAIVEKIISKHNGKVWAKAEVNNGASFYFSLPEN